MKNADYLAFPVIAGTSSQYTATRKMWDSHHYQEHMNRLKNAPSVVKQRMDNSAPRAFLHCHVKINKVQKEQERFMEIERDNMMLVSRIAHTKTKPGLDCWNNYQTKPSVNADFRKRELVRIALENQAILKKINMTTSVYDNKKWLSDFKVTREHVSLLSKYPAKASGLKLPPLKPLH
ncbi:sperm axonemal maintenance protein CFAP97D1-like [Trichomycterus rosablanca]|uniref:sperm axonemal maintenance protein CFAP97D1-like n=1 Tax=Trichomycterus rosablanca TaxID=2290929 RepID=UPI002F3598DD